VPDRGVVVGLVILGATGYFVVYRLFDTVDGVTIGSFDGSISLRAGRR
jgi:hypothetical protein